jgi:hypothetical protein
MNENSTKKNVALIVLLMGLSQLVLYSWEAWSSYSSLSEFNETFDPSTTIGIIDKTKAVTPAIPETKEPIAALESASNDLKMLNEFMHVNIEGAELRLQKMFYIICGLVLSIFAMVAYVLYPRKKF